MSEEPQFHATGDFNDPAASSTPIYDELANQQKQVDDALKDIIDTNTLHTDDEAAYQAITGETQPTTATEPGTEVAKVAEHATEVVSGRHAAVDGVGNVQALLQREAALTPDEPLKVTSYRMDRSDEAAAAMAAEAKPVSKQAEHVALATQAVDEALPTLPAPDTMLALEAPKPVEMPQTDEVHEAYQVLDTPSETPAGSKLVDLKVTKPVAEVVAEQSANVSRLDQNENYQGDTAKVAMSLEALKAVSDAVDTTKRNAESTFDRQLKPTEPVVPDLQRGEAVAPSPEWGGRPNVAMPTSRIGEQAKPVTAPIPSSELKAAGLSVDTQPHLGPIAEDKTVANGLPRQFNEPSNTQAMPKAESPSRAEYASVAQADGTKLFKAPETDKISISDSPTLAVPVTPATISPAARPTIAQRIGRFFRRPARV